MALFGTSSIRNRNHLEHTGDFEPNKVYPSRRSWDRLNQAAVGANLLTEDADAGALFNLASAFVSFEAGVAIQDFFVNYSRQVTVEDILVKGEIDRTNDFTINDHSALVEKMEATEAFGEALPTEQVQNLANYFVTLPSEVAMKLWIVLGNGEIQNTVELHQSTAADGTSVSGYLVELLTGEAAE